MSVSEDPVSPGQRIVHLFVKRHVQGFIYFYITFALLSIAFDVIVMGHLCYGFTIMHKTQCSYNHFNGIPMH